MIDALQTISIIILGITVVIQSWTIRQLTRAIRTITTWQTGRREPQSPADRLGRADQE